MLCFVVGGVREGVCWGVSLLNFSEVKRINELEITSCMQDRVLEVSGLVTHDLE
jgi:hypothetical protein